MKNTTPTIRALTWFLAAMFFLLATGCGDSKPPPPATAQANRSASPNGSATPVQPSYLVVGNTGGIGVFVRRTPDMADKIKAWPDGTMMEIVGVDTEGGGRTWKNVRDPDGYIGWVPAEYLVVPEETIVPGTLRPAVPTPLPRGGGAVTYVIDGDTFDAQIDGRTERVRVVGIDAPEGEAPFFIEATQQARSLLLNKQVWLARDSTQDDRDTYQRILRYVTLPDGSDFGRSMIRNGWAKEYTYNGKAPYQRQAVYRQAEAQAKGECLGIWVELCRVPPTPTGCNPAPSGYNCPSCAPIKGNADSGIYHMPGGEYYNATRPEACFPTEAAAQAAGYRKSRR